MQRCNNNEKRVNYFGFIIYNREITVGPARVLQIYFGGDESQLFYLNRVKALVAVGDLSWPIIKTLLRVLMTKPWETSVCCVRVWKVLDPQIIRC